MIQLFARFSLSVKHLKTSEIAVFITQYLSYDTLPGLNTWWNRGEKNYAMASVFCVRKVSKYQYPFFSIFLSHDQKHSQNIHYDKNDFGSMSKYSTSTKNCKICSLKNFLMSLLVTIYACSIIHSASTWTGTSFYFCMKNFYT